jgi:hypothetical protein
VGFHFSPYLKKKWGLSERINGTYHNNGGTLDFWICTDDKKAAHYEYSNMVRLLIHEISHGDARITGVPDRTHIMDYNLHAVEHTPILIDYRQKNLEKEAMGLMQQLIAFLKEKLWKLSK